MLFQGYAAIFQIIYLPGALLLHFLMPGVAGARKIIMAFGLSLIANYCMVFALTGMGLYTQPVLYAIFGLELLLFFNLNFASIIRFIQQPVGPVIKKKAIDIFLRLKLVDERCGGNRGVYLSPRGWFIFGGAFVCLAIVFGELVKGILSLTVFLGGDDTVSWNRWALDWFSGNFPRHTWHYPQLLPANWSIAYVFMGASIQYIPRLIMPLFLFFLMAAMINLGVRRLSLAFFLSSIAITLYIYNSGYWKYVTSGYADIPIAFMGFLPIYCLLLIGRNDHLEVIKKYVIMGSIFAGGACVTKQAGLFVFLLYPVLTFLILRNLGKGHFRLKDIFYLVGIHVGVGLVIVMPFYVYKQMQIIRGLDTSEIGWVTNGIYHGASFLQRLVDAVVLFIKHNIFHLGPWFRQIDYSVHIFVHILFIFAYFLVFYFALKDRVFFYLFFLILAPYWLIWSLFYSYCLRNFYLALPFYTLGIGFGIERILFLNTTKHIWQWVKQVKIMWGLILLGTLIFILNRYYSAEHLIQRQAFLSLQLNKPLINKALLEYHKANRIKLAVLSDYQFTDIIPLKDIPSSHTDLFTEENFKFFRNARILYEKALKDQNVGYILIPDVAAKFYYGDINEKIRNGFGELIFETDGYRFIKIKRS